MISSQKETLGSQTMSNTHLVLTGVDERMTIPGLLSRPAAVYHQLTSGHERRLV